MRIRKSNLLRLRYEKRLCKDSHIREFAFNEALMEIIEPGN